MNPTTSNNNKSATPNNQHQQSATDAYLQQINSTTETNRQANSAAGTNNHNNNNNNHRVNQNSNHPTGQSGQPITSNIVNSTHSSSRPSNPAPSDYPSEQKSSSHPFINLSPLSGLPPRGIFPTNRYQKIRTIRKTLFGKVVLYIDLIINRQVAIKLSDKQLLSRGTTTTGNKVAENPLEEIRIMNILSGQLIKSHCQINLLPAEVRAGSRYVLTSLGEYEDNDYLYTVMPFCGKGEFFDLVCHETRFSELKAKIYFLQMVYGVRLMHALGMAHLDLSLENLLMTDSMELKICDYGVTRHLIFNDKGEVQQFQPAFNNKPGKLGYMSKEIFASQPFHGPASDIWSMGIILFISLFGVPPYQVPALSDQRFALIVTGQIRRLLQAWKMNDLVSEDAISLISDMLCDEDKRINIEQILNHPWLKEFKTNKTQNQQQQINPTNNPAQQLNNSANSSHLINSVSPSSVDEKKEDSKRMETQ